MTGAWDLSQENISRSRIGTYDVSQDIHTNSLELPEFKYYTETSSLYPEDVYGRIKKSLADLLSLRVELGCEFRYSEAFMESEKTSERIGELDPPGNIPGSIFFACVRRMDLWLILSVRQRRMGNGKQCGVGRMTEQSRLH